VQRGRTTYAAFLVTHPAFLVVGPVRDLPQMMWPDTEPFVPVGYRPPITIPRPGAAGRVMLVAAMVLAVLALGLSRLRATARRGPVEAVGWAMLLLVAPHLVLVWHGDAMQVERHAVQAALQAWLGLLLVVVGAWDRQIKGLDDDDDAETDGDGDVGVANGRSPNGLHSQP
jgi:drug/metabolite transporter (DMT)-like permease